MRRLRNTAAFVVAALLFGLFVFQIGVSYEYQHNKNPPRKDRSEQSKREKANSKETSKPTTVQIECEPTCAAKPANESGEHDSIYRHIYKLLQKIIDDPVAGFTGLLFIATIILGGIAWKQIADGRVIQRAYVKMSHRSNGIAEWRGQAGIQIEIKNHGQTPARVTATCVEHVRVRDITELPDEPVYNLNNISERSAFLVRDDLFGIFESFGFPIENLPQRGGDILVVYGFVDYIDAFGARYRAGYARRYVPALQNNNLIFLDHPGYDYDRRRNRGEGIDWGQN